MREEIKELKAGAPAPKIPETPELIEMRKQLERMTREGAEAKVAALRAEGKVTPAMEPAVRELLCARQMNLRVADKDSDVAAQVEMIFASLPKGAALDMSERTKRFTAEPNPNDKDHDADPKELRAAGAAAATAVQGRKA